MPSRSTWYGDGIFSKTDARGREVFYFRTHYQGRVYSEHAGLKESVARARRELRREQIKAGTWQPPKARRAQEVVTFASFAARFIRDYPGQRDTRRSDYIPNMVKTLERYFGTRRLRDIAPRDVDQFRIRRGEDFEAKWGFRIANGTLRKEIAALKMMLRYAVRWALLERNPAENVVRPPESRPKDRYLTREEWARLYDQIPEWLRGAPRRPVAFSSIHGQIRVQNPALSCGTAASNQFANGDLTQFEVCR